jgi:O-antigen/teichoic acid export membrane protein
MSCSILALATCPGAIWQGLMNMVPPWAPWAFWGVVAMIVLWVLSQIKNVAGYPGVIGFLGVAAYLIGYWRGHKGESVIPVPHEMLPPGHPDAAPSAQLRGNSEVLAKTVVRPAPRPPNDTPPPSLTSP